MADRWNLVKTIQDLADEFWACVKKSPADSEACWIWTGKPNPYGYGRLNRRGISKKPLYAHRIAWELTYGPVPEGKHVLHRCDNTICVRPDHLFLGNQTVNNADRHAKGRTASGDRSGARTKRTVNSFVRNHGSGLYGEKHPQAKLSDADVALLRQRWAAGEYKSRAEAGRAFGISFRHAINLIEGRNRKEVQYQDPQDQASDC